MKDEILNTLKDFKAIKTSTEAKKDDIKGVLRVLRLSFDDFFTKKMLALSILPFLFSSALFLALLSYFANNAQSSVSQWLLGFGFVANSAFLSGLVENILNYVFLLSFYVFGIFFALVLSAFFSSVLAGFFTPIISKDINAKYYKKDILKSVGAISLIKIYALVLLKFVLLLLCALCVFFVPVLNLIAFNMAFFYLFYKFMFIDVSSACANEDEFYALISSGSTFWFKLIAFGFYLLCLVPFLGLFLQLYFVSVFSHLIFIRLQK